MEKLFTEEEFINARSKDKLPLRCAGCKGIFYSKKFRITAVAKNTPENKHASKCLYCSNSCAMKHLKCNSSKIVKCKTCNKEFKKINAEIQRTKNHFCSCSCAGKYSSCNKKHGTRRSKLEKWLEIKLTDKYPTLNICYNKIDNINAELDIYIPSLKMAFEINGIFHYKPIYGDEKLKKIQKKDLEKIKICKNKKIELHIIDVSNETKETKILVFSFIEKKIDSLQALSQQQ